MTRYSPLPVFGDEEDTDEHQELNSAESAAEDPNHSEGGVVAHRSDSEKVKSSPSEEEEVKLDQEEEILLRWKIEKWRWWPNKMLQQYAFYPWKHFIRIFIGHGFLALFLPLMLFIVLLSYAITIHNEISSTVETDCVVLNDQRESFKKSLIFGRQWRDALFVTYNTTSAINLNTVVYVCYSGDEIDECSRKFQVGSTFGCMYDPQNTTHVLDDVSSHQIDRAFTSTAVISPLILLAVIIVIGLPFYNKRGTNYDSPSSFLTESTFAPLSEDQEAACSDNYTKIEGLEQVNPPFYRDYLMATAHRHNSVLRELVMEMEFESAVDPHPIASRAVEDADEYVSKIFEGEKVIEVSTNQSVEWKTRFITYAGTIIACASFGIGMWLLAFGSHELPQKTVGDSLKFVRSTVIWYGIGCLGFLISWIYFMLMMMRWNISGWASGINVTTNRREVKLKGGRGLWCLFGVFAEVSPLSKDLKKLQARVRVGSRIHSWLKPTSSGSASELQGV